VSESRPPDPQEPRYTSAFPPDGDVPMQNAIVAWLDDRLRISRFAQEALDKVFPDHWSFMLGEIALYSFVVLVLTGIFLTFFYQASSVATVYQGSYPPLRGLEVSAAYDSVLKLSFDVRAGLVMRQTHHWAALVFIGSIVLHLCRIFFTGAFRRPRELNWIIGITLLLLALFNGFSGYSLPDDLLSGTGLRIMYSITLSVPFIGPWIAFLLFGGEFPADQILGRLFTLHILIVPALLTGLLLAHLASVWHQKHTDFPGRGHTEDNVVGSRLWPTYATKAVGLFFLVFAVLTALGGLVQINPVWLYGPFKASQVTSPAQPDWYLGWLEGAIRLFPNWEIRGFGHEIPEPFFPGVLLPGVTFLLLYAWPFLERRVSKDYSAHNLLDRPRDRPMRTALGAATLSFYAVLFAAASNDLIAHWFGVDISAITWAFRIVVVVLPPLVAYTTYRLCLGLRNAGDVRLTHMPLSAIRVRARGPGEATGD
jgi:ubiquinol-cytochrome c reductase cytochrome b subunit